MSTKERVMMFKGMDHLQGGNASASCCGWEEGKDGRVLLVQVRGFRHATEEGGLKPPLQSTRVTQVRRSKDRPLRRSMKHAYTRATACGNARDGTTWRLINI